jgi:hypothetical protein
MMMRERIPKSASKCNFQTYMFKHISSCTVIKSVIIIAINCTQTPIYVFPEVKLCGIVTNSYIHESVSYLYISRIGLPI